MPCLSSHGGAKDDGTRRERVAACQGAETENLLLLALQGSDAMEPLRQWLKLLLQSSPKLASLHAVAADHGKNSCLRTFHDLMCCSEQNYLQGSDCPMPFPALLAPSWMKGAEAVSLV